MTDQIPVDEMDDKSLTREAIRDELGAQNAYDAYARNTSDPKAKRVYKDIAREEGVHVGELAQVYSEQDPDAVKDMNEGRKEVKTMKSFRDIYDTRRSAVLGKASGHIEKKMTPEEMMARMYAGKKQAPMPDTSISGDAPPKEEGGDEALKGLGKIGRDKARARITQTLKLANQWADIEGLQAGPERDRFIASIVSDISKALQNNDRKKSEMATEMHREAREVSTPQVPSDAHVDQNVVTPTGQRPDGTYTTKVISGAKPKTVSAEKPDKPKDADMKTDKKVFPSSKEEPKKGTVVETKTFPERVPHVRNPKPQRISRPGADREYRPQYTTLNTEKEGKAIAEDNKANVKQKERQQARDEEYKKKNARSDARRGQNGSLASQGKKRVRGKTVESKKSASMHIAKIGELSGRGPVKERLGGDWNFTDPEMKAALRGAAFADRYDYILAQNDFKERYGRNPTDAERMRLFYSTMPLVQDFLEYIPEKKRGFGKREFPTGHVFSEIDWQHVPGASPVIPTYLPKLARDESSKKGYFRIVYPNGKSRVVTDTDDRQYEKAMRAMDTEKDPDTGRPQGRRVQYKIPGPEGSEEGTYIEPVYKDFRSYRLSGRQKDRLMYYASMPDLPTDEVWVPSKWDYLHKRYGTWMPEFAVKFDETKGEHVPIMSEKQIDQYLHDEYVKRYGKEPGGGIKLNTHGNRDENGILTPDVENTAYAYAKYMAGDDDDIFDRRSVQEWMENFEREGNRFVPNGDGKTFTLMMLDGSTSKITLNELKEWSDYMFDARMTEFRKFIGNGGKLDTDFEKIALAMKTDPKSWDDVIQAPKPDPEGNKKEMYAHFKTEEWMEDPDTRAKFLKIYFPGKEGISDEELADAMLDYAYRAYDKLLAGDQTEYLGAMHNVDRKLYSKYGVHLEDLQDAGANLDEGEINAAKDREYPEGMEGFGEFSSDQSVAANGRKTRDYHMRNNYPGSASHRRAVEMHEQQRKTEDEVINENIDAVAKALELVQGVDREWKGKYGGRNAYSHYVGFGKDIKEGKVQVGIDKNGEVEVLRKTWVENPDNPMHGGSDPNAPRFIQTLIKDDKYSNTIKGMLDFIWAGMPDFKLLPRESTENAKRIVEVLSDMDPEDVVRGIEVPLIERDGEERVHRYNGDAVLRMLASAANRFVRDTTLSPEKRQEYLNARKILSYVIKENMKKDTDIADLESQARTEASLIPRLRNSRYTDPTTKKQRVRYNEFRDEGQKLSRDDIGMHLGAYDTYSKLYGEEYPEVAKDRESIRMQLLGDKVSSLDPVEYDQAIQSEVDNAVKTLEAMGIEVTDRDIAGFEADAIDKVNKQKLDWAKGEITDEIVEKEIKRRARERTASRYISEKIANGMRDSDEYRRKYSGLGENSDYNNAVLLHDRISAINAGLDPETVRDEGYTGPLVQTDFTPKDTSTPEQLAMDEAFAEEGRGQERIEDKKKVDDAKAKSTPSSKPKARAQEKLKEDAKNSKKAKGRKSTQNKGSDEKKDVPKKETEKETSKRVPAPHTRGRQIDVQGILHSRDSETTPKEETRSEPVITDTVTEPKKASASFRDIYNKRRNDVINKYRGM